MNNFFVGYQCTVKHLEELQVFHRGTGLLISQSLNISCSVTNKQVD